MSVNRSDTAAYTAAFRTEVIPDLERRCWLAGFDIVTSEKTYADVISEVMAHALIRGAGHLKSDHFQKLESWIAMRVLKSEAGVSGVWAETVLISDVAAAQVALWEYRQGG